MIMVYFILSSIIARVNETANICRKLKPLTDYLNMTLVSGPNVSI